MPLDGSRPLHHKRISHFGYAGVFGPRWDHLDRCPDHLPQYLMRARVHVGLAVR